MHRTSMNFRATRRCAQPARLSPILATLVVTCLGLTACQATKPSGEVASTAQSASSAEEAAQSFAQNAAESADAATAESAAAEAPARPQISFGDGERNWIKTAGLTRTGATLTFTEVKIDGDGWLVLHPFRDGKPVGDTYVGSTFLRSGLNRHVEITVDEEPATGEMFLVMLHSDVNRNQEFDFVFVDERNVLDQAVFEGTRMIAHPIASP